MDERQNKPMPDPEEKSTTDPALAVPTTPSDREKLREALLDAMAALDDDPRTVAELTRLGRLITRAGCSASGMLLTRLELVEKVREEMSQRYCTALSREDADSLIDWGSLDLDEVKSLIKGRR